MSKTISIILAVVIATIAIGIVATALNEYSTVAAKNGTGCAPGSNGFIHSKGKCFHPENILKNDTGD